MLAWTAAQAPLSPCRGALLGLMGRGLLGNRLYGWSFWLRGLRERYIFITQKGQQFVSGLLGRLFRDFYGVAGIGGEIS